MAEEKKTEEKKAAPKATSVELTDNQKWELEHAELVEARKAAQNAVWEQRNPSAETTAKAAAADEAEAKKASKAAAKNGDEAKAAPKAEEKAALKKETFPNPYQTQK